MSSIPNYRARDALKSTLPDTLRDPSFASAIRNEESVQKWLNALLINVGEPIAPGDMSGNTASLTSKFPPAPPVGSGALSEQQYSSAFNPIAASSH